MKPLGIRAYGSIPHLPGSRRGPADKGLSEDQASILTAKTRKGDRVIVTEKLDGSNTGLQPGRYFPEYKGGEILWNWYPGSSEYWTLSVK